MIAQNELIAQRKLPNKTDNHTVTFRHRAGTTLVQIK